MKVYDNGSDSDRYTVVLNNGDVYCLSDDANLPNGVCQYAGKWEDSATIFINTIGRQLLPSEIPNSVLIAMDYVISKSEADQ